MTTTGHRQWSLRHLPGVGTSVADSAAGVLRPLPPAARRMLAQQARPAVCRRGDDLIRQGAEGTGIYVIQRGTATFWSSGDAGADSAAPVVVGRVGPGDIVGESCVLDASRRYDCTVRADGTLHAVLIPAEAVRQAAQADAATAATLNRLEAQLDAARFLRLLSPLAGVEPAALWALAEQVRRRRVAVGEEIAPTGDDASCLLLADGVAEVVESKPSPGDSARRRLHAGALFAEAALLEGGSSDDRVVAASDCTVYEVPRTALLAALATSSAATAALLRMVELDSRPRRAEGVDVVTVHDRPGVSAILSGAPSGLDFQLSPAGEWLWAHLDGERTVRQLILDVFYGVHVLDPSGVARIVAQLAEAGFVTGTPAPSAAVAQLVHPSLLQRLVVHVRRALEWRVAWSGADDPVTRLYQRLVRRAYTRTGAVVAAAVGVAGLAALVTGLPRHHPQPASGVVAVVLVGAYLLALVLHEAGHAFTTKAAHRRVRSVGIGWYWFGPMAFVDTTDVWSAPRRQRLMVSLAGPLADAVFGGLFALAALGAGTTAGGGALWDVAVVFYLAVLLNLNPLMEYDGYYVLIDYVERPNLRAEALGWLRSTFVGLVTGRASARGHLLDLCYGVGSTLYVAGMAALTLLVYRASVEHWIASAGNRDLASAMGWLVAVTIAVLCLLGAASEFRRTQTSDL